MQFIVYTNLFCFVVNNAICYSSIRRVISVEPKDTRDPFWQLIYIQSGKQVSCNKRKETLLNLTKIS